MPQNDGQHPEKNEPQSGVPDNHQSKHWFKTPKVIKILFDKFPLQTLPANELPRRAPLHGSENILYIFTTEEGALNNEPSFNPSCLKWQASFPPPSCSLNTPYLQFSIQTYLKFCGLEFKTVPSSNHASPTGSLPFLLPAASSTNTTSPTTTTQPIPSTSLPKYIHSQSLHLPEETLPNSIAYTSLLNGPIRNCYLYHLYLNRPNFQSIVLPLYVNPSSTSPPVRAFLAHTLHTAATTELRKTFPNGIDVENLYSEAEKAFQALSTVLGEREWFSDAQDGPGELDAGVFAYVNVLLEEEGMGGGWVDGRMQRGLRGLRNLVGFRRRVYKRYYCG
ncbi:hypothetical protein MMC09_004514 [Bachmanniomyces sp. S44760]|nr:hypothetical protein [Bachmanniomyces sp. S44760]